MAKKGKRKGKVRYKLPPLHCRLCKHLLNDDFFIEEYKNCYVCDANDEISKEFLKHCHDFKISKWALVEFLNSELADIKKQIMNIMNKCIDIESWNSLINALKVDKPDLERLKLK